MEKRLMTVAAAIAVSTSMAFAQTGRTHQNAFASKSFDR